MSRLRPPFIDPASSGNYGPPFANIAHRLPDPNRGLGRRNFGIIFSRPDSGAVMTTAIGDSKPRLGAE